MSALGEDVFKIDSIANARCYHSSSSPNESTGLQLDCKVITKCREKCLSKQFNTKYFIPLRPITADLHYNKLQ